MIAAVRSELTRLRQPRLLVTWFGLMALFAMLVNTIMVTFVSGGGSLPPGAPGRGVPHPRRDGEPVRPHGRAGRRIQHVRHRDPVLLGGRDRGRLQQRADPSPRRRRAAPMAPARGQGRSPW